MLVLSEGALWLYGSGTARLELDAPSPTEVVVFADGRSLGPHRVDGATTITADLPNEGWHAFVVRGEPGLELLGAGFR